MSSRWPAARSAAPGTGGTQAARMAGWLFLAAGLLAVGNHFNPLAPATEGVALLLLGLADLGVAALCWVLPWERWHPMTPVTLALLALGMIAASEAAGLLSPYIYGVFFVVTFVGVGLAFPRWTSLLMITPATLAYLLPLLRSRHPDEAVLSTWVVIPVCLLVGETAAFAMDRLRLARSQAERRAAELARSRERLAEAQRIGRSGSWEWDLASGEVTWSEELYRMFGVDADDFVPSYEAFLARLHPDDRDRMEERVTRSLEDRTPFEEEVRIIHLDGSERSIQSRGDVVFAPDGEPARMVGTAVDVTERREAERARAELVAVVSHELRTPLTSVSGVLELLAGGELGELSGEAAEMVGMALDSSHRLIRLLNDLLDVERLESGLVELQQEARPAAELIEGAKAAMRSMAEREGVELRAQGVADRVWADPERVLQVLVNLIGNAFKYSPAGAVVRVSAERVGEEVVFRVADRGRGIPSDRLELIFERFQQVDQGDARERGGTGMGLAICRSIVKRHGGRIWAESRSGEGSTFSFTLPAVDGHSPVTELSPPTRGSVGELPYISTATASTRDRS